MNSPLSLALKQSFEVLDDFFNLSLVMFPSKRLGRDRKAFSWSPQGHENENDQFFEFTHR